MVAVVVIVVIGRFVVLRCVLNISKVCLIGRLEIVFC